MRICGAAALGCVWNAAAMLPTPPNPALRTMTVPLRLSQRSLGPSGIRSWKYPIGWGFGST
eukprot:4300874-Alexandrium_andersonii.AAC.1